MAHASDPALRPTQSQRPRGPFRTLSSSLRGYSTPLLPRGPNRSKTTLPSTHEVGETEALLPRHKSEPHALKSVNSDQLTDGCVHDDNDDDDVEAEQTDEQADSDGLYPPNCSWTIDQRHPPKRSDPFGNRNCDIYGNIHRVRRAIINSIDDPYSLEQLKSPRMNLSIVRPLVDKLWAIQDLSIVYCLLVNRARFIRDQSIAAHHHSVNLTRALLCELVAEKVLRRYNECNPGPRGLLKLANILVAGFEPFQGAPESVIQDSSYATFLLHKKAAGRHHHKLTALEVAIVSEAKSFLASAACKKVVDAIFRGKVVYSPSSFVDIMPDRWKRRPISLYDPRRAPILNQYRLVVPRTRNCIEVVQFVILLVLYITVMTQRQKRTSTRYGYVELVFNVYSFGWILDQTGSILEHGWKVYTQNLWSFLDVMFSILFLIYFSLRMHALRVLDPELSDLWSITSLDVLSCAAPVLIPRLAFNVMSENMLFLSLRAMMGDFITLTALAFWSFAGFLLSLKWLHNDRYDTHEILTWMIFVWFGLDGTGISEAPSFHPYLGPILMITFAFLGNTLFLTILVSMLSNTFSLIASNADQEIQYRRAVLTFMGVKSDALFAFMPPFNILAVLVFAPLKWFLTPRMFHTVNVFVVRVINLPTLVLLSWYERNTLWVSSQFRGIRHKRVEWKDRSTPKTIVKNWWSQTLHSWSLYRLSAQSDIQAVFESEPPESLFHEEDNEEPTQPENGEANHTGLSCSAKSGSLLQKRIQGLSKPAAARSPVISSGDEPGNHSPTASKPQKLKSRMRNPKLRDINRSSADVLATLPNTTRTSVTSARAGGRSLSPMFAFNRQSINRVSQPRHSSIASDSALRAEFHDSEDEKEAAHRKRSRVASGSSNANRPTTMVKRLERKDSTIDYNDTGMAAVEATVRLSEMERRLSRIENLLIRAVEGAIDEEDDGGGDDYDAAVISGDEDNNDNSEDEDGDGEDSGNGSPTDAETEQALQDDIRRETKT